MSENRPVAVNPPYSNDRIKTTIRILRELWEEFKADVQAKDLSTCHVLEGLMKAWLYGGSMVPGLAQPFTLNLTMQHVVSRPRRVGFEPPTSPGEGGPRIPRKWSSRRVPRDARCIGCKHHGSSAEYNQAFQGILIYHWCKARGRALCDVPDEVLRTCELRET